MLLVSVGKAYPGDARPVIARRVNWNYPPGVKPIAEYWLQHPDMTVVSIIEADSPAPVLAMTTEWSDAFEWTVVPAVTAEEGIELFKSAAQ